MALIFQQIRRMDSGCVTYLVGSTETKECAIVDPLLDADYVMEEAKKAGLKIAYVIDTHTHADHISGARAIAKKSRLPGVHMSEKSQGKFKTIIPVRDGQAIKLGQDVELKFVYTPGHTYDHVCVLVNNEKVLTGDTLFIGDVGRIDLGGDARDKSDKLFDSLHGKLMKLADGVEVYPTHVGAAHHLANAKMSSTIGAERENNGALKASDKDAFFKYMTEDWPPKPPDYQNIIRVNSSDDWLYGFVTNDLMKKWLAEDKE
ncbi:Zn-dependent hydrolase, glyoxylase [Candidatus Nitrososphaera evergladensis SR1]|uniref:Zn-dependent hydrolase, glyoxylase n=1 Tax=Candidatus Nitrososphaera evergladensis SR1 TaxID=1459636 RepID=A0A075MRE4_9ARCH|nr:MBL fold metallo-hydrolase [Candidatus Nitrososphaera evergladensis]AIF83387.1 Zn-dependent hydrolase, glyoxylase [Candidatus Nitrososphaera evergladensis SR1]